MFRHKTISLFCLVAAIVLIVAAYCSIVPWRSLFIVIIVWLGLTGWGVSDIRLGYFTSVIFKVKTDNNTIAITFDDGPTPFTGKILDLLGRYDAKATFFCIGRQINSYPEIFNRIHREGHMIANHTYSHSNFFGFFSSAKVKGEIQATDMLIRRLTGKENKYFRPPFGITNPHIAKAVNDTGHKVVGWNIRSLDTIIDDENKILKRITKKLKPGSIVLLHDTSDKTVNALEELLYILKKKNYRMVTVEKFITDE